MPAGEINSRQLIKLAEELEVLLRARSPLGPGLRDAAQRWRGPLRPAAEQLALRLDSGVPVDEALRSSPDLPLVFRSLAAAGLATNRAVEILQAYSRSTRQLLDLRERLLRGIMYPAIILLMGYGLAVLLINSVLPEMAEVISDFSKTPPPWAASVEQARETLPIWSWAIPAGLIGVTGILNLLFSHRLSVVGWWGMLPFVRGILVDIHTSTASHLLASLLDCDVPLPLALSLAGESLSSPSRQSAVQAISEDIQNGIPAPRAFHDRSGAPPLWRALFVRESEPAPIAAGLMHVSDILAERARGRADFLGRAIPLLLIVLVGGLTVAAYGAAVFGPLITIWERIGGPP